MKKRTIRAVLGILLALAAIAYANAAEVNLAWDAAVPTGGATVTGHEIAISSQDPTLAAPERTLLVANVTSATVTGLAPGTRYYFGVRALDENLALRSLLSNIVDKLIPPAQAATCPCTVFDTALLPTILADTDSAAVELGVRFSPNVDGFITGIRFYKGSGNDGVHTGTLWTNEGAQLATATFSSETATGWQTVYFSNPVAVVKGTPYVASYQAPQGHYAVTQNFFVQDYASSEITLLADVAGSVNGLYLYGQGFPINSYLSSNYFVDVVFNTATVTPPPPPPPTPTPAITFTIKSPLAVQVTFTPKWTTGTTNLVWSFPGGNPATSTRTTNGTSKTVYPGPGDYIVTLTRTVSGVTTAETKAITITAAGYAFK